LAEVFVDRFGLGRGLDNDDVHDLLLTSPCSPCRLPMGPAAQLSSYDPLPSG
jgi:hypothetical protein